MTAILLQNATKLLQNASGFLLPNAMVITNCNNFVTKCDSYYEMRRLLQIAAVHSKSKYIEKTRMHIVKN